MHQILIRAAERAARDPRYLAHRLGPDLRAAAARLGITEQQAYTLYLCRVSVSEEDVRRVAGACGLSVCVVRGLCGAVFVPPRISPVNPASPANSPGKWQVLLGSGVRPV